MRIVHGFRRDRYFHFRLHGLSQRSPACRGCAPAEIVGTPAVSAPQRNGAYAAEERIEAQVVVQAPPEHVRQVGPGVSLECAVDLHVLPPVGR